MKSASHTLSHREDKPKTFRVLLSITTEEDERRHDEEAAADAEEAGRHACRKCRGGGEHTCAPVDRPLLAAADAIHKRL